VIRRPWILSDADIEGLADLLIDRVEGGTSMSQGGRGDTTVGYRRLA
jgi:hypothetical protein